MQYFNKVKTPITDLIGKGAKQISMLDVPIQQVSEYCCEDVDFTYRLWSRLTDELEQRPDLHKLYFTMELPLVHVLFDMERNGIYMDEEVIDTMSAKIKNQTEELEKEIPDLAGRPFNVGSPKQLSQVLFQEMGISPPKGMIGLSTWTRRHFSIIMLSPRYSVSARRRTSESARSARGHYCALCQCSI